jgi:diguanylate cyclase (GGDEF)-like protein/putative nucleotidyltransferase with HDIG domain
MRSERNKKYSEYYRWLIAFLGIVIVGKAVYGTYSTPPNYQWIALLSLTLLLSWTIAKLLPSSESSFITNSDAFVFLAFQLYGAEIALLIAAFVIYSESLRYTKKTIVRAANVGFTCLSFFLAMFLTTKYFGPLSVLAHLSKSFLSYCSALITLAFLQGVINQFLISIFFLLKNDFRFARKWFTDNIWILVTPLSGVTIAAIVNSLVFYYGFWMVLMTIPLIGLAYAISLPFVKNIEAARRHAQEMDDLHERTLQAFASAVDAKDKTSTKNVRRIQVHVEEMGRALALSEKELKALHAGALLRDIGKVAVPDYILTKPGKLTPYEFSRMQQHTVIGAQILEQIDFPYPLAEIVRFHHENWDGTGYPEGLQGEEIPLTARILSIVEYYDSLREDRPNRKALTREAAIKELISEKGSLFDPELLELFIQNLPICEAKITELKIETAPIKALEHRKAETAESSTTPSFVQAIQESRLSSQVNYGLLTLAENFASSMDINDYYQFLANNVERILPFQEQFDSLVIHELSEETGEAEIVFAHGLDAVDFRGCKLRLHEGVTGFVLTSNEQQINCPPNDDIFHLWRQKDETFSFKKYLTMNAIALKKGDQQFGAMVIYSGSRQEFTEEQADNVSRLASLCSDAFLNARRFAATSEAAMHDAITNLPNARFLHEHFSREIKIAATEIHPLRLLLVDLRTFRQTLEQIEPNSVEATTRDLAKMLKKQIRKNDKIIHYCGDEYVVLIHDAPEDMLLDIIARFQSTVIESRPLLLSAEDALLGINIGSAVIDGENLKLNNALDTALLSLQAGRATRFKSMHLLPL